MSARLLKTTNLLKRAIQIGETIIEAPLDTIKYTKAYFITNSGREFDG
ncbi:hypothetical protein [Maledivibacter halophilus]|nr:hypothetical protein [Maledivibacter halophilus]